MVNKLSTVWTMIKTKKSQFIKMELFYWFDKT